jgi:diketogulonate reductase-like aldo/keto reductase
MYRFTPVSGQDLTGPIPYDPESKVNVAVRKSFESSLRNLHRGEQWSWGEESDKGKSDTEKANRRRPWIDSYLLHSPLNTLEETLQAWNTMEDLVEEGKVRQIGFSSE